MKDASCNSPEDKRKTVQIRATSTKCHISDPCQVGNEKKLRSTSNPSLFNIFWPMQSRFNFSMRCHRTPNL